MARRVPQQQQHTVPGLGTIGPPDGAQPDQRRGNRGHGGARPGHQHEPHQRPGQGQRGHGSHRSAGSHSPAPAPVSVRGYEKAVPYQQQHEVPGLQPAEPRRAGRGSSRSKENIEPQHGRRAELTEAERITLNRGGREGEKGEMLSGDGAAAAMGAGGSWGENTFPAEYHAKPANRAPPDAAQVLSRARDDPQLPAVGEMLAQAEKELARKTEELDALGAPLCLLVPAVTTVHGD